MPLGTTIKFKQGITSEEAANVLLTCVEMFPDKIDAEDLESVDWQGGMKAGGCPVKSLPPIPKCLLCDGANGHMSEMRSNATHMSVSGSPCCPYHKAKEVSQTHIKELYEFPLIPIRNAEMFAAAQKEMGRLLLPEDDMTEERQNHIDVLTMLLLDFQNKDV